MKYEKTTFLKSGKELVMRNCTEKDSKAVLDVFNRTHAETDFLLTYPDENTFDEAKEAEFLKEKCNSENEIEILGFIDGKLVGTAGINTVGKHCKVRHRAEFGIGILREYWGQGIGKALTNACIECAKKAGYSQLELDVVSQNKNAIELYKKCGFTEYGRNPKGFLLRTGRYQEVMYMRLEL